MDAISLNLRTPAELPSVSVKRNSEDVSTSVDQSDQTAGTNLASVNTAEKVDDPSKKLSTEDNKNDTNKKDIEIAVNDANRFFEQISRELRFQKSESGNEFVVQVVDQKTQEVIRQFPSEEMLQISKDLEKISGLLFKDSA